VPIVYLVDSAGARITDQVQMFPGRRHAGRIFHNQVMLSGRVPQVCLLFGPSAAGGAYIPAFCDVVIMVEGNASMYLGSPRMAEVVVGEKVTLEEMGGARMHCTVSGCGDFLVADDAEAIDVAKAYLGYLPQSFREEPDVRPALDPAAGAKAIDAIVPDAANKGYDMRLVVEALVDEGSFLAGQEALRQGAAHRLRPDSTVASSGCLPTSRCRKAVCCSSIPPTRPPASSGCATLSTSPCSSSPTCPAS